MHSIEYDLKQGWEQWLDVNIGNSALAMITMRVRGKRIDSSPTAVNPIGKGGVKADGTDFKPYSTKTTLIGAKSFKSKTYSDLVFDTKKKRAELEWRTVHGHRLALLPGGYKKIRDIEGSQTTYKDFERTGALWKSIHVMGTEERGGGNFQTTIGPLAQDSIHKMEGVKKNEGTDLLALSTSETQKLVEILGHKLEQIFNRG